MARVKDPQRRDSARGENDLRQTGATRKWYCGCKEPPVLLGTLDATGEIHLKARDRYWHVRGTVVAVCPLCGCDHSLEPGDALEGAVIVPTPLAADLEPGI